MKKIKMLYLICFSMFFSAVSTAAVKPMSDDEVKKMIIDGVLSSYDGSCPCPYSTFKKEEKEVVCGANSAYMQLKTNKPKCYSEDILKYEITDYRNQHDIPQKK